jgi:hypothetical protein
MQQNLKYFIVGESSPVLPLIQDGVAERKALHAWVDAFEARTGATHVMVQPETGLFVGVRFDGIVPPKGWKHSPKTKVFQPNSASAAGRAIIEDILETFPTITGGEGFTRNLEVLTGLTLHSYTANKKNPCLGDFTWSGFGVFGDQSFLSVPAVCPIDVAGLTPIDWLELQVIINKHNAESKVAA